MSKITNRLAYFAKLKQRSDSLTKTVAEWEEIWEKEGKTDASGSIKPDNIDRQDFPEMRDPYTTERYSKEISNSVNFPNPGIQGTVTDEHVKARAQKVAAGHLGGESKWFINEVMVENKYVRGVSLMIGGWTGKGSVTRKVQVEGSWVINDGPYEYGTEVQVEFIPAAGYRFASWSDGGLNPHTVTMNDDVVLTVSAEQIPVYTLAFSASGLGAVTATADGNAITSPAKLEAGVAVVLTPTPGEGYVFDEWTGLPTGTTVVDHVASFSMPDANVSANANFITVPVFQGLKLTNVPTVTSITVDGYVWPFYAISQGDHYFQWGTSSGQISTDKRNPTVEDLAYDGGESLSITAVTTSSENTLEFSPDYATGFQSMSYSLDDGASFNPWPTASGVGGLRVEHAAAGQYAGDYVYGYEGSEGYWWYLVTDTEKYVTTTVRNPQVGDSVYCNGEHELAGGITSVTPGCVESIEIESSPGVTYWFTDVPSSGSAPYRWTAEDAAPIFTAVRHPSIGTSVYSSRSSETPSSTVTAATQETAFVSVTYTGSICLKGKSDVWTTEVVQNSFKSSICVNASGRLSSIISDTDTPQELEEFSLGSVFGAMTPGTFPGVSVVDASGLVLDDTLNVASYGAMFADNVTLTVAPSVLPATTLASECYGSMFLGCIGLTSAPSLPATTLAEYCYNSMFLGCTSLVNAPEVLPALELPADCYCEMFENCTSLVTAPAISATSFGEIDPNGEGACYCMFQGCTSLVTAPPHLYAETVPATVYSSMFYGCTSLVNAPEIHAITATPNEDYNSGAFQSMFNECSSLVNPPVMTSLTTVHENCCAAMFCECTSLIESPILSATTLANYCYGEMFSGCTKLTKVTCFATDISAEGCTAEWLIDVAEEGTFHRNPDTWAGWTTGDSGIPSGWEVDPPAPADTKLKITVTGGTGKIKLKGNLQTPTHDCFVSSDDGANWSNIGTYGDIFTFNDTILVKANSSSFGGDINGNWYFDFTGTTGTIAVSGDITCLVNGGVGGVTDLSSLNSYYFAYLFKGCSQITDFSGLLLPSTTLCTGCYKSMFESCTAMTVAPTLPAPTLVDYCYQYMFYECIALPEIHCDATNISATSCTEDWLGENYIEHGDFYGKNAAGWPTGSISGIPQGWTAHLD